MIRKIVTQQLVGFLNIVCGGVGLAAGREISERYSADNRPFPQVMVSVDTDPLTADYVDQTIHIGFDAAKVDALKSDPERFGPETAVICQRFDKYLNAEDATNGSRTIRCLTQAAFNFHENEVGLGLRATIHRLVNENRVQTIIPVIISSTGGGAGSALQILLMLKFLERRFLHKLTQGFGPDLLQTPISFVCDPYALAHLHPTPHAERILANSFAFRAESEAIERRHGSKYVIHIGMANTKGTILSDQDLIARVLGTSVYEFEQCWPEIKPRLVDRTDVAALGKGYLGQDLPERRVPRWRADQIKPSTNNHDHDLNGGGVG